MLFHGSLTTTLAHYFVTIATSAAVAQFTKKQSKQ